ncbi:hypothetical protein IMG5_095080 [Ichthyophthirius multifiliis]|uniref:Uncharacterized protein n=1 Tax=Ichthyophthirius multifiliis TaxID=5932 RepID=G0QRM2_ICHMU|nr:hypothetical protein IMG5_095080 [Ichthyophthirius multifiliis]EGR32143.1 hypothetical protein IMG5_095080 [Ichthyophthirius multifiliis]|eukprot:XP_004035629.1 hypothetical protein IMG5_095080 [Ichthyophthirius multifiliis]
MAAQVSENKQQIKKNWAEIDAEQEAKERKPKIKVEISTYVREKGGENPNQKIQETIKVTKLVFPVRKIVKSRKQIDKFGEVIDIPKGQQKPGDKVQVADVNIQTNLNAEKGEIDIVNQIDRITTDKLKMKKEQERMEQLKNAKTMPNDSNNQPEEYLVDISNILPFLGPKTQQQMEQEENLFKQYLEQIIGKSGFQNRYNIRFPKHRKTKELMGRVLLIFTNQSQAEETIEKIDQQRYGVCILNAGWYVSRGDYGGRR